MSVIDDYIARLPGAQAAELERIRNIVLKIAPQAKEVISYGMPGFKYSNKYLAGMNAFKDHMSFFPTSGPIEALRDKLSGYSLSRGTIRYYLDQPLPEPLITELLRIRIAAIDGGTKY